MRTRCLHYEALQMVFAKDSRVPKQPEARPRDQGDLHTSALGI